MKLIGNCKISKDGVFLNGELKFTLSDETWKREIYTRLAID